MIKTLENGVRIVFEKNEHIRSCAVGIWVGNGSRYEDEKVNGVSHFIEHMMFKGTHTREALEIANEMDLIGGGVNAFTTKECTCYYVKTLDIHLDKATDILTDMFFNSKFDKKDMDLERTVIEEEISMYEDQPEDVCFERLLESVHSDSSLGRPILGTKETLSNINSEEIKKFISSNYLAKNTVISVSGSFDDKIIDKLTEIFSKMQNNGELCLVPAIYKKSYIMIDRDIEQNHISIGFDGLSMVDKNRYALQILNSIFGSGMSSRLFQKVREENGLCYTISSFNSAHLDCGVYTIYVALSKNTEQKALDLIKEVTVNLLQNGITDDELNRGREQIKTNILMGLESTSSRMNFLARSLLFHEKILSADEIISRYDSVTKEDIMVLARKILDFKTASICVVGDTSNQEIYNKFLS